MAGISIQVIRHDEFTMEVWVTAMNDRFSGESIVATDGGGRELISLGNRLQDFPKHINDVEKMEFGHSQWGYEEVKKERLALI